MSRAGGGELWCLGSAMVTVFELQMSNQHWNETPALGSLTRSFLPSSPRSPPRRNPIERKKRTKGKSAEMTNGHNLSGVVLLLAQSFVLLGIFSWLTVAHNRDIQTGFSAFGDWETNGYFGEVLPAAALTSLLHPNESFNWATEPKKLLRGQ